MKPAAKHHIIFYTLLKTKKVFSLPSKKKNLLPKKGNKSEKLQTIWGAVLVLGRISETSIFAVFEKNTPKIQSKISPHFHLILDGFCQFHKCSGCNPKYLHGILSF